MTRRVLKWLLGIVLVLLVLPMLAIGIVLIVANIDPGRRLIQNEAYNLTGGMVRIQGLAGRFPDAIRVGQIQVSDAQGPYVTISDVVLDWSPLALLHREAKVDLLQAGRVVVSRLPVTMLCSAKSNTPREVGVQPRSSGR